MSSRETVSPLSFFCASFIESYTSWTGRRSTTTSSKNMKASLSSTSIGSYVGFSGPQTKKMDVVRGKGGFGQNISATWSQRKLMRSSSGEASGKDGKKHLR